MAHLLELITDELIETEGAEEFYEYLEHFVYREEQGDKPNGYGGFYRGEEDIMFNFDLRSFAPQNRVYFWHAAQKALAKLKVNNANQDQGIVLLLTELLDMHKRINRAEDPMALNHLILVEPEPTEQLGPGW